MIYIIPIEPLEERYSEQWARWWPEALDSLGAEYRVINGVALTSKIETGSVLDVYGTHHYKFSQLMELMQLLRDGTIKDEDTLFFHDLWFPGIESLQYVRDMTGKKFKIAGILHAGSWDKDDFISKNGMKSWARPIEFGRMKIFDHIFLGSRFHRELIEQEFLLSAQDMDKRFHVTGLPFKAEEVMRPHGAGEKIRHIVFPHRLDEEKRPDLFDKLAQECKRDGWFFTKTKMICDTKEEYYQVLGRAAMAVSFAEQETFGYAMLEAMANGCEPLVPFDKSYASMHIYKGHTFESFEDACVKVKAFMDNFDENTALRNYEPQLAMYEPVRVIREMLSYL